MRPFGTPPRRCSARPTRWRKVAMLRGEPSWQTRSTGPTSMPSSSDAVATTARSSPARSRASTVQAALHRQAAVVGGDACRRRARSRSWWATRSAIRRVLTKTSVVRWRLDLVGERARRPRRAARSSITAPSSSSGSSIARSSGRRWPTSTIVAARARRRALERSAPGADEQPGDASRSAAGSPSSRCASAGARPRRR